MNPDEPEVWQVKVNGQPISLDAASLVQADIISCDKNCLHVIHDHRSVKATILSSDPFAKTIHVEVEGEAYEVEIRDELDHVLDKMGYGNSGGKQQQTIKAPMPGLVIQVLVTEGQELKAGEKVLVLEAMKMENSIMVQSDATVKKVHVARGAAVDKAQLLIELE